MSADISAGKKEFQCDQCDKSFGRKSNLQAHINTTHNLNLQEFQCDQCDKAFGRNANLQSEASLVPGFWRKNLLK
jgi:KRAB domain-containing zinc finger protein